MIEPVVKGVYVADISGDKKLGRHRSTKHCVCVSVGAGKYLLINTHHRDEYDDFQINAENYDFLNGVDRFLSCREPRVIQPEKLLERVGTLSDADTKILYAKIETSKKIRKFDKLDILPELWKTFR